MREMLARGVARFEKAELSYGHGTTNAMDEAAWLILRALGLPPHDLAGHLEDLLSPAQVKSVQGLLDRRIRTRKPAAYLLNEAWLGPHRFYVDERVIVPRSYIAELLLKTGDGPGLLPFGTRGPSRVRRALDLCTGSGCLAILVALAFPDAEVDAADISDEALEVAKRNVADYGLAKRVRLVRSDLFESLAGRRYDLIVSNPPYVRAASMRKLPEEYRKEPVIALASGVDGLDHARVILGSAGTHLETGGLLVVEIGHNRKALERAYPRLPFRWPPTSGGKGFVFTLSKADLEKRPA